ncbi:MAG: PaeR7I family type II restriction endonuclease, partial [Pyrinomonadaceae bacterium]
MSRLLPPKFDELVSDCVKQFWTGRISTEITSQAGGRGSVIAGKNLNAFANLIQVVGVHCGLTDDELIVASKGRQVIPGYFRATKEWDAVVIYKNRLIAAFELKSQVVSFGNNINNRSEEVLGSATDFWTAHREKGFDVHVSENSSGEIFEIVDTKPPFLGFLMLLEECAKSTGKVAVK